MAAYSKDEFYYGSDFSDFSDNEADLEPISDGVVSSDEDDIMCSCVCGLPATTDMIGCDGGECKIEWFHYQCVGLTAKTVPKGSWICDLCRPPNMRRPAPKFKKEHALNNAVDYMKTGLERIKVHPLFSGNYPMAAAVMSLVAALLNVAETSKFEEFTCTLVSALWLIATSGDDKFLQPEAMDMVWKAFHQYKLKSIKEWKAFLASLQMSTDGKHIHIVYQHLLLDMVTLIIKDRNITDSPQTQSSTCTDFALSKEEEQVLRYVAGYVPFALCEKLRRQSNATAAKFCKILSTWRTCSTNTSKTFMEYSNAWINVQNKGGLFHVKDDVYLLFRTMESAIRPTLSKENLEKCVGQNIKISLREKIMSHTRVHHYWCNLTKENVTGNNSTCLLDMVVNLYVKIRIKAFLKVYLDLKKANSQVSKKAEKALRKELAK